MAEKKKTTTTKKAVAKKAPAKKAVKKTTAKKPVAKKAPVKKAVAKKAAPKKTTTTKKAAPRVMETVSGTILSFSEWKTIVGKAFTAFKTIWWRIGLVNIMSVLTILALMGLAFGLMVLIAGGMAGLENEVVNLESGTPNLLTLWLFGLVAILVMTILFVISFLTNVANFLVVKNYRGKKANNPAQVLFKDSWNFLGRYAWMSVRVFWYIFWPVLGLALVTGALAIASMFVYQLEDLALGLGIGALVAGIVLIFWRAVRTVFAYVALIESNKKVAPSFEKALAMVQGHWWLVLWALFLFFVPLYLVQGLFDPEFIPAFIADENLQVGAAITGGVLSTIFSLFVLTPLTVSFIYELMLHFGKAKKIKL